MITANVLQTDMDKEKEGFILKTVEQKFAEFGKTSLMAKGVKEAMDAQYGPVHNVIFGDNYGASITHETGSYVKINLDQVTMLIFKA